MNYIKNILVFLIVVMIICFSELFSVTGSQIFLQNPEKWNIHMDFEDDGVTPLIDVRDLICAKKESAKGSEICNANFLSNLRRILLGLEPEENEKLNDNNEIVLPLAP